MRSAMQPRCASRISHKTLQHSPGVVNTIKLLALSTQLGKKHTTWQNSITLSFPLAGLRRVGLHRRCSHTVQPARVCSSNGSKRVPTQGREWAVYSSQHGMESADTADAGRCKDQLPSTSQAHLGGTGSVGQVGPSALLCHDLSLLAESCTAEFQICFRSVSTVCTMRSAGFTLLTDFILCS